jgi:hypothetical protein
MKKIQSTLLLVLVCLLYLLPQRTEAASYSFLAWQSSATADSITIKWSHYEPDNVIAYRIYYMDLDHWNGVWDDDEDQTFTYAGETTASSYTIQGLTAGMDYGIYLVAYCGTYSNHTGIEAASTLPGAPKITGGRWDVESITTYTIDAPMKKSISATLTNTEYVDGYRLELYSSSGRRIATQDEFPATRAASWIYKVYVDTYKYKNSYFRLKATPFVYINGARYYGTASSTYIFSQAGIKKIEKTSNTKIKLTWAKIKSAKKYRITIQNSLQNPTYKKTYLCTGTAKTINGINSQSSYWIKVDPIGTIGGRTYTANGGKWLIYSGQTVSYLLDY